MFALRAGDGGVALADAEHVLVRNERWHLLERDRTRWRATARDPAAPSTAANLIELATRAAEVMLAAGAPDFACARYVRAERDDVLDVRFERCPGRPWIGVWIRDVTRLVRAERELAIARGALEVSQR
jgi:hypothetical protein